MNDNIPFIDIKPGKCATCGSVKFKRNGARPLAGRKVQTYLCEKGHSWYPKLGKDYGWKDET